MENSFNVNSGFPILQQKPLPIGLKKYSRVNDNVYFTTESYEDQLVNRREDGTPIPLGYPVNVPMTRNGQPMSYYYYQGNVNALNKRNAGTLTEQTNNNNKPSINIPTPRNDRHFHYNLTPTSELTRNDLIEQGKLNIDYNKLNLTPNSHIKRTTRAKNKALRKQNKEFNERRTLSEAPSSASAGIAGNVAANGFLRLIGM
jgi:hypothetical protein